MIISIIAAISENNVIGYKNSLPWHLPADLAHFRKITMGHSLIMGQKTYESIGKPLPGRTNIVLSDNKNFKAKGCIIVSSIKKALEAANKYKENEVFIIGGATVYQEFINLADKLYITRIHQSFKGDKYFPKIDWKKWKLIAKEAHKKDKIIITIIHLKFTKE